MKRLVLLVLLASLAVLSSCVPAPAADAPETTPSAVVAAPTIADATKTEPAPSPAVLPTRLLVTIAPATSLPDVTPTAASATPQSMAPVPTAPPGFTTYSDPEAGFALDYPAGWSVNVPGPELRRNAQVYSASFRSTSPDSPQPRGQAIPAGETAIDVTVQRTNAASFDEMVRQRRDELLQSETETKIVSEEVWTLAGGLPAMRWEIETSMAGTVASLVTLLGDNRIMVAGMGDLSLFDDVARSLRPIGEAGAPTAAPPATAAAPAGWETYSDAPLGFSLAYPPEWELCQDTGMSRLFCLRQPESAGPSFPRFYVTVMPQGFTNADASAYNFLPESDVRDFSALSPGESRDTNGPPGYSTFVRLPDTTVDGRPGLVVENSKVWEGGANTKDRRVLIAVGTATYMLGTYYETPDELALFEQVLAGFHITEASYSQ